MSLDFRVGDIADFQEKFPDRVHESEGGGTMRFWNFDIEVLAWTTMHVDMGKITLENAEEFWIRAKMVNALTPLFQKEQDGVISTYVVPLERVREAAGFSTNVSTYTRHQFLMALKGRMDRCVTEAKKKV